MTTSFPQAARNLQIERDYYVVVELPDSKRIPRFGQLLVNVIVLPLLRFIERRWNYSVTGEIQSVKQTRAEALCALAQLQKGVAYPVLVDSDFPLETVRHGQPIYSEDFKPAVRRPCSHISVKRCDLEKLSKASDSLQRTLLRIERQGCT